MSRITTREMLLGARWTCAVLGLTTLAVLIGCSGRHEAKKSIHVRPRVRLIKPQRRTITRTAGQPGFIEAYEQTSLYPKVAGYVESWKVDIGDRIKKDQVLLVLSVPELEAQYREKKAQYALDKVQIKVSEEMVLVAGQQWKAAGAQVGEAKATVGKYKADVERWQSEVKRLTGLASERIVDKQVLEETRKQLKSSTAAMEASQATVIAAEAKESALKADLSKAKVDVEAAKAKAAVSEQTVQRYAALVGYLEIRAPYDGRVIARNVAEGDYVQPSTGDLSGPRSIQTRPNPMGTPLYVVARTDKVRIFLDVSEMDAHGVDVGSPATVRVQAVDDEDIPAKVTRTSWALHAHTRTLRAEIDVPNSKQRLLPNMYAYGEVVVRRPGVWAMPMATVTEIGNQSCCFLYEDGVAVQTPVELGINDGKWVEVRKKRVKGKWVNPTGKEEVIEADLSEISDGEHVRTE
jgi:HlyD family secretion protein